MPVRDQVRSSISIKPPLLDLPCLDHIVASQARSSSVCMTILIRDFTCNLFISSLASGDRQWHMCCLPSISKGCTSRRRGGSRSVQDLAVCILKLWVVVFFCVTWAYPSDPPRCSHPPTWSTIMCDDSRTTGVVGPVYDRIWCDMPAVSKAILMSSSLESLARSGLADLVFILEYVMLSVGCQWSI